MVTLVRSAPIKPSECVGTAETGVTFWRPVLKNKEAVIWIQMLDLSRLFDTSINGPYR